MQEAMVRAWRAFDRFEGRSSLRSWLYRIANNVCIDMMRSPQRGARPMEWGRRRPRPSRARRPAGRARLRAAGGRRAGHRARRRPGRGWRRPASRSAWPSWLRWHLPAPAVWSHPVRGAAVARLRGGRAARYVLPSVNSALQQARHAGRPGGRGARPPTRPRARGAAGAYVDAFERYDIPELVGLLRDDVVMSMPPWDIWLEGPPTWPPGS